MSTYDNCPNNTFSSFWFSENQKWTPLFHRPRKRSEAYKEMREKNSNFVNDIKYALSEKKVTPRDMKLVIILLVVKTGKDDTTNRVEIDLKDNFFYNKNDIQECLKNQYVMIKSSSSTKSTYILTQKGKNKLKEYKLSAASFKKLINKKTGFLDKLELTDNYESELLENKSAE